MLIAIIGGQSRDEEHLARIAASGGYPLEFYRAGLAEPGADSALPALAEEAEEEGTTRVRPRALLFEALDRADLALGALRAVRRDPYFDTVGALIALNANPDCADLPGEFDDFVFHPYTPQELQIRLRAVERRRPSTAAARALQVDGIEVEEASRSLLVASRSIQLTAREFALFAHLCEWRGRVLSREHLLTHVWGSRYSGGRRTVDIHVRRLRAKLGDAFPIETLRGVGYRLRYAAVGTSKQPPSSVAQPAPGSETPTARAANG